MSEMVLSVLRCPDAVPPQTRRVPGGEFTIGRGPDNDWVLPDAERHLSKRHCVLAFRSGGWHVGDTSSNGTFVNGAAEPLGPGTTHALRDGDRLRMGQYEIEVRIDEADAFRDRGSGGGGFVDARRNDGFQQQRPAADPFALDPFASDPFAATPPRTLPPTSDAGLGLGIGIGAGCIGLPADFDPLAPDPDEVALRRPTQADHTPSVSDAFRPPPVQAGGIPDDWDFEGLAPPNAPPPAEVPAIPPPLAPVEPPPSRTAASSSRAAEPRPMPPVSPARAPVPAEDAGLMAAFLRGAGMTDISPADPAASMEQLGAAFRALVSGLRRVMIARAAIKGEFRIEQTMIAARGNNPLKFSADDDDALAALLGAGRRTEMPAPTAVADALRDIRLHELASVAGMQAAVRSVVQSLGPEPILRAASEGGGLSLPGGKKGRAWDAYEALHAKVVQSLTDDFDSVFGKSFARAYEQALAETADRERNGQ